MCCVSAQLIAAPKIVTLEGDLVDGSVDSIDSNGMVHSGDRKWPLDGLRSVITADSEEVEDISDGRVVMICGSEIAARGIRVFEEEILFEVPGLGDWKLPIDAVRALRLGELRRGSRFQKGLLEWEASRDVDTVFISGGAELQEVDGLIEDLNEASLTFDREGKLQNVPRVRTYGIVLASPLLQEDERPACVLSLAGGTRMRADIVELKDGKLRLEMVEGVEMEVPWANVQRLSIRSARLAYLSELEAEKAGIRPILAPPRPWLRDRTVSGLPLKIGDTLYDRGLGFAAGTFVTFANDGPYDLFLAEIGIDADARGRGDCEFVVLAGERELFRKRVRGGTPAELIKVDITGFTSVTLRVDAGEDLDLADHADWADACFLQRGK